MNFRTIVNEVHAQIKGVRATFERENDLLTRVYLTTETGDCYCIKLGNQGDRLEVLRRTTEQRAPLNEAIAPRSATVETLETAANASPAE